MKFEKMITTIDTHVAGEAFRIVIHSSITLDKNDITLNHHLLQEKYKYEKYLLLNEPRGHRGMNGCIVTPSDLADFALLFFNHDNDAHFKYGGIVTTLTALLETGNLEINNTNEYKIETLNGIRSIKATIKNQKVTSVYFESNECLVKDRNPEYSLVEVDGNRNYLIFSLPAYIPKIHLEHLSLIKKWGEETTEKYILNDHFDGIILTESFNPSLNQIRSITFEKDGRIIRSPGIDSTFAIFTVLLSTLNKPISLTNQSIFDSELTANLISNTNYRFSIETQGFLTGMHQFIYDQDDPFKEGFLLK